MENKKTDDVDYKSISNTEIAQLKSGILSSVNVYARRKKRLKYLMGMAATIALLFCFGIYFNQTNTESITDFVKSTKNIEK